MLGDSIIRNVGTEFSDMKVECFPGIRTEQLHSVIESRDVGSSHTAVIHVGTNNLRRTGNLDYVMGDVFDLANTAKTKFSTSRIVLSGVLRRRDLSWRRIGAVNSRYEWVTKTLGVTFVDTDCWVDDWEFCRDGLHIYQIGTKTLGELYCRVCGTGSGRQKMRSV